LFYHLNSLLENWVIKKQQQHWMQWYLFV